MSTITSLKHKEINAESAISEFLGCRKCEIFFAKITVWELYLLGGKTFDLCNQDREMWITKEEKTKEIQWQHTIKTVENKTHVLDHITNYSRVIRSCCL